MGRLPKVFGVVGSGQMGAGIAQVRCGSSPFDAPTRKKPEHLLPHRARCMQVAAAAGLHVHLVDRSAAQLERAKAGILDSLQRLAGKGKLPADEVEASLGRITTASEMEVCDVVRITCWGRGANGKLAADAQPLPAVCGLLFLCRLCSHLPNSVLCCAALRCAGAGPGGLCGGGSPRGRGAQALSLPLAGPGKLSSLASQPADGSIPYGPLFFLLAEATGTARIPYPVIPHALTCRRR